MRKTPPGDAFEGMVRSSIEFWRWYKQEFLGGVEQGMKKDPVGCASLLLPWLREERRLWHGFVLEKFNIELAPEESELDFRILEPDKRPHRLQDVVVLYDALAHYDMAGLAYETMKDTAVEMQDAGYGPFDTASNQMSFNPYFFALQMPDNTRIQPTVGVVKPALNAAELPLGECLRGNVSFEVPQGQTPSYVLLTNPPTKWAIE